MPKDQDGKPITYPTPKFETNFPEPKAQPQEVEISPKPKTKAEWIAFLQRASSMSPYKLPSIGLHGGAKSSGELVQRNTEDGETTSAIEDVAEPSLSSLSGV